MKKIWYAPNKKEAYGDAEIQAVVDCLNDGWLAGFGPRTVKFEEDIAKTFGKFDEQRAIQHGYSDLVFQLGTNRIFPGLIEGIDLLHYGDKAVLFVPSKLGYGAQGAGNVIPPNADIIFEIELLNKK